MAKNTPRQILGKVGSLPGDIQRVTGSIATGASTINSMTARLDAAVRGAAASGPVSGAIKSGLSGVTGALNRGAARVNAWASGLNSAGTVAAGTLSPIATASNNINQSITALQNCQQVLHASSLVVDAIMDSVTGHFHPRANEQVLLEFNNEWDLWAGAVEDTYRRLSPTGTANVLQSLARASFGNEVFALGSAIKKNSAGIFGGIADFEDSIHAFEGSYRNPVLAAKKIERGVKGIIGATERVANSINGMVTTYQAKMGYAGVPNPILSYISDLHSQPAVIALNKTLTFGGGAATLYSDGAVLGQALENRDWKTVYEIGKKTYGDARTIIDGLRDPDEAMKVTELAKGYPTGSAAPISPDVLDSLDETEKGGDGGTGEDVVDDSGNDAVGNGSEDGETKDALVEDKGGEAKDGAGDNDDENAQEGPSDASEFGKADSYVCSGATMRCSFGDKSARLTVYPDRTVFLTGQPMANISDHTSLYNIAPFGKCHTTRYPATGAATAAAHGRLTPMPCVPGTKSNWRNGKDDYIIKGNPALLKSSYCKCCYGGIIRIVKDGQVDTCSADLSKQSIETAEEWTAKEQEELLEDKNALLDGIQTALDLAGFAPGVGAIPDLLNAAIYAVRGDKLSASLSLLAAVPGIGDAAAAAKIAGKGVKAVKTTNKLSKIRNITKESQRKATLVREAKNFISIDISIKQLLHMGLSKNEADFFLKKVRYFRRDAAYNVYSKSPDINMFNIESHLNAMDVSSPIEILKVRKGERIGMFVNKDIKGNLAKPGNYAFYIVLGKGIPTTDQLAVAKYGMQRVEYAIPGKNQKVPRADNYIFKKEFHEVEALQDIECVKSISRKTTDTWSDKLHPKKLPGGAEQLFLLNKNYLKIIK